MERAMGIEPTWSTWKADALPLSYTRLDFLNLKFPFLSYIYYTTNFAVCQELFWWNRRCQRNIPLLIFTSGEKNFLTPQYIKYRIDYQLDTLDWFGAKEFLD